MPNIGLVNTPARYALGLDPGLATFGLAVVGLATGRCVEMAYFGAPKAKNASSADDRRRRARELGVWLLSVCQQVRPVIVCAEDMSFARGANAIIAMAMAWGVVTTVLNAMGLPLVTASPPDIKRAIMGPTWKPGKRAKGVKKSEADSVLYARMLRDHPYLGGLMSNINPSDREHPMDAFGAYLACQRSELVLLARRHHDRPLQLPSR